MLQLAAGIGCWLLAAYAARQAKRYRMARLGLLWSPEAVRRLWDRSLREAEGFYTLVAIAAGAAPIIRLLLWLVWHV